MKILIYGCGYLGTAMARHWKAAGHEITVTTRSENRREQLQEIAHHVHLIEENNIDSSLKSQEAILLCVAPGPDGNYRETYYETALKLTKHLTSSTHTLIYTSSTSLYGDHEGAWVDEEATLKPTNANGEILWQTEQLILNKCPSLATIFRLGEILGPGRFLSERLKKAGSKPFSGGGAHVANLSALPDIMEGLEFAREKQLKGIYNFCSDFHPSRRSLYQQICSIHELPPPVWDNARVSAHAGNKIVSSHKITQAGFKFNTPHSYYLM